MERYSKILEKQKREIVLLIGRPCFWGKCSFCDYINDNSINKEYAISENSKVLKKVRGDFSILELINSGSVFELPKETLIEIREVARKKKIRRLIFEAHFAYKDRLSEIKEFFSDFEVLFKTGIESFDEDFRENFLNKNAKFESVEEVEKYFDSPCLLIGIKGQSKEIIDRDIEICKNHFKWSTINIFSPNSTKLERDEDLVKWFLDKYYKELKESPRFEILLENTDFGVGD